MSDTSDVTIFHNPDCGTSRNTLAMIRRAGIEPTIVEYLKTPPDRALLESLIARMGIRPRAVLRDKGSLYSELLIDQMLAHPSLINRPIVVTAQGVRLCRPIERLMEILPGAKHEE
jgi:arsenate reductase